MWLPIYGALRALGLDMFRAMSALIVLVLAGGYVAAWRLFARELALPEAAAAVGAFVVVFGHALTGKLMHGQMIGAAVLPAILLLLHAGWRVRRPLLAVAAGVLTGLLAATSYIVAWFFLLAAGIAVIAALGLSSGFRRNLPGRTIAGAVVGVLVGLGPFAWIYGAQILDGPRRSTRIGDFYRPLGSDLFNLGRDHPVWGGALGLLGIPGGDPSSLVERMMGASPPVWVAACLGLVWLWRRRGGLSAGRLALMFGAFAMAGITLAQFRYGGRLWPWRLVFEYVPGAAAIRTSFRSQIVAMLPLAGLAAFGLVAVGRRRMLAVALGLACLAETAFVHPPYGVSARAEAASLAAAPSPPPACRVFALAPQPPGRAAFVLQSDALMLALHWHLPTANGNSSWTPEGWRLGDPAAAGYAAGLADWVRGHRLAQGFCLYDRAGARFLAPGEAAVILGD